MIRNLAFAAAAAAVGAVMFFVRSRLGHKIEAAAADGIEISKGQKRGRSLTMLTGLLSFWLAAGLLITAVFGEKVREPFTVEILAPMVDFGFIKISSAAIWGTGVMLTLSLLCVAFRLFAVPRFKEKPAGIQNVIELAIESVEKFTVSSLPEPLGENLTAYMLTLPLFLVGCAAVELFGVRSPTSDLTTTFALSFVTFVLIIYYAFREKGLGRLRDYVTPAPFMAPIKIITDCAVPVSMACRLFGNMLAGVIIMELIYYAMGNFASGVPALVGLYFNLFHPVIQAYIFMTLTLSFIGEAVEPAEGAPQRPKRLSRANGPRGPEAFGEIPYDDIKPERF